MWKYLAVSGIVIRSLLSINDVFMRLEQPQARIIIRNATLDKLEDAGIEMSKMHKWHQYMFQRMIAMRHDIYLDRRWIVDDYALDSARFGSHSWLLSRMLEHIEDPEAAESDQHVSIQITLKLTKHSTIYISGKSTFDDT